MLHSSPRENLEDMLDVLIHSYKEEDSVMKRIDFLQLIKQIFVLVLSECEQNRDKFSEYYDSTTAMLTESSDALSQSNCATERSNFFNFVHLQILRLILDIFHTQEPPNEQTLDVLNKFLITTDLVNSDYILYVGYHELAERYNKHPPPLLPQVLSPIVCVIHISVDDLDMACMMLNEGVLTGSVHFGKYSIVFYSQTFKYGGRTDDMDQLYLEEDVSATCLEIPYAVVLEIIWTKDDTLSVSLIDSPVISGWKGLAVLGADLINAAETITVHFSLQDSHDESRIKELLPVTEEPVLAGPSEDPVHTPLGEEQYTMDDPTTLEEPNAPRKGVASFSPHIKRVSFGAHEDLAELESAFPSSSRNSLLRSLEEGEALEDDEELGKTGEAALEMTPLPVARVAGEQMGSRNSLSELRKVSLRSKVVKDLQESIGQFDVEPQRRSTTSTTASDGEMFDFTPPKDLKELWSQITEQECNAIFSNNVSPVRTSSPSLCSPLSLAANNSEYQHIAQRWEERYRSLYRKAALELKHLERRYEEQIVAAYTETSIELKKGKELHLRCAKEIECLLATASKMSDNVYRNFVESLQEHHMQTKQARDYVCNQVRQRLDELVRKNQRLT